MNSSINRMKELYRKFLHFRRDDQIDYLRDLEAIINSGVPLFNAFSLFSNTYSGGAQEVSRSALMFLNQGKPFTNALPGWFPDEVITPLRIAEDRGIFTETFPRVIAFMEGGKAGLSLFIGKLLYPVLILAISFFMATQMSKEAYPVIADLKPIEEWDELSQSIYFYWEWVQANIGWLLIGLCIVFFVIRWSLFNLVGRVRERLDDFPIFKQYRMMQASLFLQVYGLLLADLAPLSALEEVDKGANKYMRSHINKMKKMLAAGRSENARYMDTGLLTGSQMSRLVVLSDANDFDKAVALMGEQTLTKTVAALTKSASFSMYVMLSVAGFHLLSVVAGVLLSSQSI